MAELKKYVMVLFLVSVCAEVAYGQTCSATDQSSLLYFSREFVYCRDEFKTWNPTGNCCNWDGVYCDSSGNVYALELFNPLAVLPYPQGLLYYIGTGLLGLKNLISLTIRNVAFNGAIPASWGTGLGNVQNVTLTGCNIVGPMPDSLCNWKTLRSFNMSNNLMTGTLPSCFKTPYTSFPNIITWDISGNNFSP